MKKIFIFVFILVCILIGYYIIKEVIVTEEDRGLIKTYDIKEVSFSLTKDSVVLKNSEEIIIYDNTGKRLKDIPVDKFYNYQVETSDNYILIINYEENSGELYTSMGELVWSKFFEKDVILSDMNNVGFYILNNDNMLEHYDFQYNLVWSINTPKSYLPVIISSDKEEDKVMLGLYNLVKGNNDFYYDDIVRLYEDGERIKISEEESISEMPLFYKSYDNGFYFLTLDKYYFYDTEYNLINNPTYDYIIKMINNNIQDELVLLVYNKEDLLNRSYLRVIKDSDVAAYFYLGIDILAVDKNDSRVVAISKDKVYIYDDEKLIDEKIIPSDPYSIRFIDDNIYVIIYEDNILFDKIDK